MFVYCNAPISKKRFIWMCAAPNIILGFIPYIILLMGNFDFSVQIANILVISSWLMIVAGIGDYVNIYNAIRQVPKGGKIINYGLHSFWIN